MKHIPEFGIDEKKIFIGVLIAASIAFIWVLIPFFAPILWGCILAVIFNPLYRILSERLPDRPNVVAALTLTLASLIVVLPIITILSTVIAEATQIFQGYQAGNIDLDQYIKKITGVLASLQSRLGYLNINIEDINTQLSQALSGAANFMTKQSLAIGQNTLSFFLNTGLALYLAYFMLRDGHRIMHLIKIAFPMDDDRESALFQKFSEVTRATVKGNLVVGMVQGALGGLIFWYLDVQPAILWAVVMALASLIPAVGTALVWAPVAVYFLAVGQYTDGIVLVAYGVLVIGIADNVLRPILVGRDTKLPDYVVLMSTLGGIGLVGIHGFVVGPLIAALFFALWSMFINEFNPDEAIHLTVTASTPPAKDTNTADDDA